MRRLGVEVAAGRLIAVTVNRGRVSRAQTVTLPPGDVSAGSPRLRPRLGGAPVHVAISEPDNVHRTLLLPPMTSQERADVAMREAGREGEAAKAVAWQLVRRLEVEGLPKDELLVVLASQERLQRALAPIIRTAGTPRVVVTGSLALLAAARALSSTRLDRPTALVHWGLSMLTIVIASEGVLKFARVVEPPPALDFFDWLPVEIDRSIRQHAVLSKGERVEEVMMSVADAASAGRVFTGGELSDRLRLPVTNLNALLSPALPQPWSAELAPGAYTLAYGAAVQGAGDAPNLVPPALLLQQRSRKVIVAAAGVSAAAIMMVTTQTLPLARQAQELRDRLARIQAEISRSQALVDEITRAEIEREEMAQLARLLADDPLSLTPPAASLREIARLAPADLRLAQITMSIDAQGYAMNLLGQVDLTDLADAQGTLNEFYDGLRRSPLFHSVSIQQSARIGPMAAGGEGETASGERLPAAAVDASEQPLGFVLLLRLKRLA